MAKIRVRVIAEFEIDPEAYVAAGIEAEWIEDGDFYSDQQLAYVAVGYCSAEDNLPRWARDSMRVTSEIVEVLP